MINELVAEFIVKYAEKYPGSDKILDLHPPFDALTVMGGVLEYQLKRHPEDSAEMTMMVAEHLDWVLEVTALEAEIWG